METQRPFSFTPFLIVLLGIVVVIGGYTMIFSLGDEAKQTETASTTGIADASAKVQEKSKAPAEVEKKAEKEEPARPEPQSLPVESALAAKIASLGAGGQSIEGLSIAGQELSRAEMDRTLVYLFGQRLLERKIVTFLVEEELQNRISEGVDPKSFAVIGEELDKRVADQKELLKTTNPGMDFEQVLRGLGHTVETYKEELVTWMAFEKLFLPDDPKQWPAVTREILKAKGATQLLDTVEKNQGEEGKNQGLPLQLRTALLGWLVQELKKATTIQYARDGVPAENVLTVNGRPFRTAEAVTLLGPRLTPARRTLALKWLAVATAARKALEKEGHYLSDEAYAERLAEYKKPYDQPNSIFPLETVVLGLKKFPTMEVFYQYFRLLESYRDKIAKEFTEENLGSHLDLVRDFFGGGTADIHVILCSAYDFDTASPLGAEAWAKAKEKADTVQTILDKGTDFEEALDSYSDFPEAAAAQPNAFKLNKGRCNRPGQKNELKRELGEDEFQTLLAGYSVADVIFDPGREGTFGPIKGPLGYYFIKIVRKSPGRKAVSLENEKQRKLVEEDYLATRFRIWAHEVASQAAIEAQTSNK